MKSSSSILVFAVLTVLVSMLDIVHANYYESTCQLECFHDGKCRTDDEGIFYWCECPVTDEGGYQGIRCHEPFISCSDNGQRSWRCLNGGSCVNDQLGCNCPSSFKGKFCETYDGPCEADGNALLIGSECVKKGLNTVAIIGIVVGSLAGAALFFVAGGTLARRGLRRTRKESSTEHYPHGSKDEVEVEAGEIKIEELK